MKRKYALALFILILSIAKISEHPPAVHPAPKKTLIYREGERIIAREGFMDLPRAEREKMLRIICIIN